ncbi:MAG: serine/threonine-protein kinase [Gemmatimonadaceae bacterium]
MATHELSGNIGKYQILNLVGEGAMGTVYRARDPVLNRNVAVKVMSDAIARDGELRDRFMREAQAAGSLQHPNVVTIYDFGEFEGHLFIAMEYVEGVDLEQIIAEKRLISLDERLGIIVDVLVGLSYAHKHGVVHRDIKPANIRVNEEGRAKIMDFGIAHLDNAKMTRTGVMMGTPNYMAPEQVTGDRITAATDIFSVGAVLYEMLTGGKAFAGESLHSVLFKVVSEEPRPLEVVAPALPALLTDVLRRALAKNPADRYQEAIAMASDLNGVRALAANTPSKSATLSLSTTLSRKAAPVVATPGAAAPAVPTAVAAAPVAPASSRPRTQTVLAVAIPAIAVVAVLAWSAMRPASPPATTDSSGANAPAIVATADTAVPASGTLGNGTVDSLSPSAVAPSSAGAAVAAAASAERDASAREASAREAELVRTVRSTAVAQRARASQRGAPEAQLSRGDTQIRRADVLAGQGRHAEAVQQINGAVAIWNEAERNAVRARAAAAAAESTRLAAAAPTAPVAPVPLAATQQPARRESTPPPVVATPPERVAEASANAAASAAVSAAATEAQLTQLIADYARAIESRDVARIRDVYPAITSEQSQRFEQFFRAVRSVRAVLAGARPDITGTTATSRVTGTYEFVEQSGSTKLQTVVFNVSFRRDGTRWRIAGVR